MFILGGTDALDNFSRRVTLFSKYNRFVEKPMMLSKRAFFPGLFCLNDNCVYAFGGNNGEEDLSNCERFSALENVWRPIRNM